MALDTCHQSATPLTLRRTFRCRTGLTVQAKSGNAGRKRQDFRRTRFMADNDYKHGEMNITEQEKTFDGFMRYVVNIGIVCIAIIIFLAIFAV
jgi:small-conductance mechanosensitive channel